MILPEKSFTCFYCDITHDKVECEGMLHCPNALCPGPGGGWFRYTLDSYEEVENMRHTVDEKEWHEKGKVHNERNNIMVNE